MIIQDRFGELMLDQQVLGTSRNLGSGDFATEGFSKVVVSNMEMDTDLFQQDICIYINIYIHEISIQWRIFHICMFQILAKKTDSKRKLFFPLAGVGWASHPCFHITFQSPNCWWFGLVGERW